MPWVQNDSDLTGTVRWRVKDVVSNSTSIEAFQDNLLCLLFFFFFFGQLGEYFSVITQTYGLKFFDQGLFIFIHS